MTASAVPARHRVKRLPPPKERSVQRDIVAGLRALGVRCVAIPNGQKIAGTAEQRARMAIALRREGLVAGFPDLLVYRANGPQGLMEVKREGARLTGDHAARQLDCHAALKADGWNVAIVRSLDDAIEVATAWGLITPLAPQAEW